MKINLPPKGISNLPLPSPPPPPFKKNNPETHTIQQPFSVRWIASTQIKKKKKERKKEKNPRRTLYQCYKQLSHSWSFSCYIQWSLAICSPTSLTYVHTQNYVACSWQSPKHQNTPSLAIHILWSKLWHLRNRRFSFILDWSQVC